MKVATTQAPVQTKFPIKKTGFLARAKQGYEDTKQNQSFWLVMLAFLITLLVFTGYAVNKWVFPTKKKKKY